MRKRFSPLGISLGLALASLAGQGQSAAPPPERITVVGNEFRVCNGTQRIWMGGGNTPWFLWNDFGNASFNVATWDTHYQTLITNKINSSRVWITCSGEVGINIGVTGTVGTGAPGSGGTAKHWADLDAFFAMAATRKMYVKATLMSFDHFKSTYTTYTRWRNWINSSANVDSYINNYLTEFLNRYGNNPYLWSIDLCNEPEWASESENTGDCAQYGCIQWTRFQYAWGKMAKAIHDWNTANGHGPLVTVGMGFVKHQSTRVGGSNKVSDAILTGPAAGNAANARLDFWDTHYYLWQQAQVGNPFTQTPNTYFAASLDRPAMLGECPNDGGSDSDPPSAVDGPRTLLQDINDAYNNGWQGFGPWTTNNAGSGNFGDWDNDLNDATVPFDAAHPGLMFPPACAGATATPTRTRTPTATSTRTASPSITPTRTATASATRTPSPTSTPFSGTVWTVSTSGLAFTPAAITITVGEAVQWTNLQPGHNVAQSNAPADNAYNGTGFRSGAVGAVMSYLVAFPTVGTYYYVCEAHAAGGMKGVVYVLPLATSTPTPTPTRTASPTGTMTPSFTRTASPSATASPTPSRTASPSGTMTGTDTRTATPSPSPAFSATSTVTSTRSGTPTSTRTGTFTSTLTATLSWTVSATPSPTRSSTATSSATPSGTATSSVSPTSSRTSTSTATSSATPGPSATSTATPSASSTASPTATPTSSRTISATATSTISPTLTRTASPSASPSSTPTGTPSISPTGTMTLSPTASGTNTPGPSATSSVTPSRTATSSATPSATPTLASTLTRTPSSSPSSTPLPSATPSTTLTLSSSPTNTPGASPTYTATSSISPTSSDTPTASRTASPSPSASFSATPTGTRTPSSSPTPSATLTTSPTPTATPSISLTPSSSSTNTPGPSPTSTVTPSPSASGTATNSPSQTSTASSTAPATSTPSATLTWSPSATPTATVTPSSTPAASAIASPSPSPTGTLTPSSSAPSPEPTPGGSVEILKSCPLPNPDPRSIAVLLEGRVDKVVVKVWSVNFRLLAVGASPTGGPGWCRVPLPAAFLNGPPAAGTYYYSVQAFQGDRRSKSRTGTFLVLR